MFRLSSHEGIVLFQTEIYFLRMLTASGVQSSKKVRFGEEIAVIILKKKGGAFECNETHETGQKRKRLEINKS